MGPSKLSKPILMAHSRAPVLKRGDEDDSDDGMKQAQRLQEYNRFRMDPPELNADGTEKFNL
jgi:hypothetical protein